jgi:DNA helicase-4
MVGRAEFLISSGQAKPHEILMLAYGKKAADEMRDRVEKNISQKGINAQTFHSLGLSILSEAQNGRPTITPLAEDEKLCNKHVDLWFEELLDEKGYRKKVLKYFERYLYPSKNAFDFGTEGEYFAYQEANELRTYKGELVKSYEELIIANWLFRMGVEYEYEARYKIATRTPDFRDYHPDFYLPGPDIYIEHLGVRRDGSTAVYIDQTSYWAGIEWKRLLHEQHETTLIETYSYENFEGNLLESLQQKLEDAEVTLDPLPDEAVLETLREFGAICKFSELLGKLLVLYKANGLHRGHQANLQKDIEQSPQMKAALELLQPILDRYQQRLESQGAIDFEDMIIEAIEIVSEGQFKHPWKFIMVDEFQDISEPRASLVEKLRDAGEDISLFCVGDDWQAIYRFAGSDINIISGFEGFFGTTKTTCLDKTFRFNNSICDISSKFVMQNQAQIEKALITPEKVETPAVSLFRGSLHQTAKVGYLKTILSKIQERAGDNATVYLLARYRFELFESQDLRSLKNHVPNLHIDQLTFHGSKGKEADYVIVLGLLRGKLGFPSEKATDPLLNQLLPVAEPFPFAEERRLFYVAMTRARHRVYLVTDMTVASTFVTELLDDKYPLEFNEFDTELSQEFVQNLTCPKCSTGHLVPQESEHGVFYGCSHFPRCKHTEDGCRKCGLPMKRGEDLRTCIDESCGEQSPVCKLCKADMRVRNGHHGPFWGCKNYRDNQVGIRCTNTYNLVNTLH